MIYNLNEKFTKVEENKGVLENKSIHSAIELVVTDGVLEKDTGIELQPKEKMPFALEDGKSLYARCSDLNHAGANLAVVNFNVPATGGAGAGTLESVTLFSGFVAGSKTVDPSILTLNGDMTKYDFILIHSKYGWQKFSNIDLAKYFSLFSASAYASETMNCFCNITRLSNTTIGQSWMNIGPGWNVNGAKNGIYRVLGLRIKNN